MRARIALALLGTAVGALLLAGLATFAIVQVTARAEAEERVRGQAVALADALAPVDGRRIVGLRSQALARLAEGLEVEELSIVVVDVDGNVRGEIPAGATEADVRRAATTGQTISGRRRGRAWAAAPVEGPLRPPPDQPTGPGTSVPSSSPIPLPLVGGTAVIVASDPATPSTAPVVRVFSWIALGTVAVGALVSLLLARGLTRPLRRAEDATGRIAAGDLSARAPDPGPRTPAEIADLTRSINAMAGTLERSRGLERQFLMSVSHDLRTPLTSIRGWAEAISDGTAPDPARAAEIITAEARRLDRLVGDLLDLARLDARRFSFVPADLEVGALVSAVVAGLRPDAEALELQLDVEDRSDGATARLDGDRVGQVIANLVENALKFAAHRVVVAVEVAADGIVLEVGDDGPGIAAEDLPHVFERLYVSRHRPARRESGSGLGLAIVRELVTAMGGTVDARSPIGPDGGTALRVVLPRTSPPPSPSHPT